jgi:HSP20 family protein
MNTNNGMTLWTEALNPIHGFRREFDRLFDDWLPHSPRGLRTDSQFVPVCDVEEREDHYSLSIEMAGVKKDDIKMEVLDNQLVISGERRQESQRKESGQAYSERRFGKFQRTFGLPNGVDSSQVEASLQDGILHIVIPKAESAKPRQIKISTGISGSKFFGKFLSQSKDKEEAQSPTQESRAAS